MVKLCGDIVSWTSYQINKVMGAHAPGMPGTFSPPPWVSDPDMHHGTCVTHVSWCMPGSLNSGFLWSQRQGKTFPAFPAHAQPADLRIRQEAHWWVTHFYSLLPWTLSLPIWWVWPDFAGENWLTWGFARDRRYKLHFGLLNGIYAISIFSCHHQADNWYTLPTIEVFWQFYNQTSSTSVTIHATMMSMERQKFWWRCWHETKTVGLVGIFLPCAW